MNYRQEIRRKSICRSKWLHRMVLVVKFAKSNRYKKRNNRK